MLLAAALAYLPNLSRQPWFADESAIIAQTYYYHLYVRQGDLWHPDWQRTGGMQDPPLAKYLVGRRLNE